jgi:hypothetical protein
MNTAMSADAVIAAFGHESGIFALMNTAWAWPIAESLHFIGLCLLLGTIGIVDLRLLGLAKEIPLLELHRITRFGVAGFAINLVTGMLFFVSDPSQYLYNPAFQLKVTCMLLAAANVALFYGIAWPRIRRATVPEAPAIARLCAAASLSAWVGVIVFGRLITFYRPPEHWCFWCSA